MWIFVKLLSLRNFFGNQNVFFTQRKFNNKKHFLLKAFLYCKKQFLNLDIAHINDNQKTNKSIYIFDCRMSRKNLIYEKGSCRFGTL